MEVRVVGTGRRGRAELATDARIPETRRRILQAALGEFARKGLDGASVKTMSERAGVANGTVFWHFGTKSRLYVEVVHWAADEFYQAVLPVADAPGASFLQVIDSQIEFLRDNPSINALLASLRSEHPRPEVREATRRVDARVVAIWRRWVAGRRTMVRAVPTAGSTNVTRLIATTVSSVLAMPSFDARVDVRAVLAEFAGLLESPVGERWILGTRAGTSQSVPMD